MYQPLNVYTRPQSFVEKVWGRNVSPRSQSEMEEVQLLEWLGRIASLNPFMLFELVRSRQDDQWQFTPSKQWHLDVGDIVTGGVALHRAQGNHALFLLASPKPLYASELTYELLMLNLASGKPTTLFHFQTAAGNNQYHILDGPMVVWGERGAYIRVSYLDSPTPHSLHIQTFMECYKGVEWVIERFWVFDWSETERGDAILLLFAQVTPEEMEIDVVGTAATSSIAWLCLKITISTQKIDVLVEPAQHLLIPNDYGCIATCLALHKFHVVDSSGAIIPRHQFLVGTSYQQVVIFENGSLVHCVPLQGTPRNIATMEVSDGQLGFAVQTQEGKAAAFKVTVKGVQECGTWKDVSSLLVGDFAGIGHDQLLVALHGGSAVSKFCITDLVEFTANSKVKKCAEQQSQRTSQPCPESLIGALRALQVRKQEGEAYLMDLQRDLQQKAQLLENGIHFMKSLIVMEACDADRVMFKPDPSLVNLLPGGSADVVRPVKPNSDRHGDHGVKIVHSWQRVVEEQWVVGMVIRNEMKFSLQEVSLSMVSAAGRMPQDCSSRIMWLETGADIDLPSSAKKQKLSTSHQPSDQGGDIVTLLPFKRACVVVKTPLSALSPSALDVSLVCSWKRVDRPNCEVAELGRVSLSVAEVVSGALNCSEEESLLLWNGKCSLLPEEIDMKETQYQDLSCLLAAKAVVQLEAQSTFTNLHRLPAMLKARLPLPPHAIREVIMGANTISKCDSKSRNHSEVLDGAYLCISTDVHSAKISIMYRNIPQLSLLLERIRSGLPEDISFQAVGDTSCTETLATCLRCLGEELTTRTSSLRCSLHGNGSDEPIQLHSSHSDKALVALMYRF